MKTTIYILLGFIVTNLLPAQNRFNMSQYMLQHSFINPAAIGNQETFNAAIFHRSQWVGLSGAPVTQGLNVNMPFKSAKHTLGFTIMHDKIGSNDNTSLSLGYAFKARLSPKTSLLLGLSGTLEILKVNYTSLYFNDVVDPAFNSNATSFLPNFKYGMYLMSGKFYGGLAIPALLDNKIVANGKGQTTFNAQSLHYYLQAGYLFTLNNHTQLGTSTLIKQVSGSPLQLDLNAQVIMMKKIGLGISYRTSKELVGLINYQITPLFKLGYSYDYGFSKLRTYNSGSHEIVLIFSQVSNKKHVRVQTPRM